MNRTEFIEYYKNICQPMSAMLKLAPKDKLDWKPTPKSWTLGQVLNHCTRTPDTLIMAIKESWPTPEEMQKFQANSLTVPSMQGEEAAVAFEKSKENALQELSKLSDSDFNSKQTSTPFGTKGSIGMILQGVADHQNNHKHELFTYLKLVGLPVNTWTLYFGKME